MEYAMQWVWYIEGSQYWVNGQLREGYWTIREIVDEVSGYPKETSREFVDFADVVWC